MNTLNKIEIKIFLQFCNWRNIMESKFQHCKMMISRLIAKYFVTYYDAFKESFVAFSSSNLIREQTTLVNKSKTTLGTKATL